MDFQLQGNLYRREAIMGLTKGLSSLIVAFLDMTYNGRAEEQSENMCWRHIVPAFNNVQLKVF